MGPRSRAQGSRTARTGRGRPWSASRETLRHAVLADDLRRARGSGEAPSHCPHDAAHLLDGLQLFQPVDACDLLIAVDRCMVVVRRLGRRITAGRPEISKETCMHGDILL